MKNKWKELIINLLVIAIVLSMTLPYVNYGDKIILEEDFMLERSGTSFILTGEDILLNLTLSENFYPAYEFYQSFYYGNDSATLILLFEFTQLEERFVILEAANNRNSSIQVFTTILDVFDDEPLYYDFYWWHSEIHSYTSVGDGFLLTGGEWVLIDLQVMME